MPKVCVIGWPIKHSRSPLIHGFWLKKYGIAGSYEKRAVEPEHLTSFLETLSSNKFAGCNVTIPHKEKVFEQVTVIDPVTEKIGAVNTVYTIGTKLYGLNTDGYGFLSNLKSTTSWESSGNICSVIGAGGATRAIIAALIDDGIKKIYLFNRTLAKAEKLAAEFGTVVQPKSLETLEIYLTEADLLVNATSLGMMDQPPLKISLEKLRPSSVVVDIVYDPLETDFLKQARRNGNMVVDGLGMLLHQAVPGFEKWFGIRPEVTKELRDIVVNDLTKDQLT